jgi:putative hydrolase of the HAD superfamily
MSRFARRGQTIVIDADDTLWHNNIHFERAIEEFIEYLDHSTMSRDEVRSVLDQIELANLRTHGYGSLSFARNLRQCYERLVEREIDEDQIAVVMQFGERILSSDIQLIDGVAETLDVLSRRHSLVLMTKGNEEEQLLKVDRSGIGSYFGHVVVVAEKDVAAFTNLVAKLRMKSDHTWMIGNSPRSDINPALAAGLNAVFIPHEHTWSLEHEELSWGPGILLILERFTQLLEHF